MLVRRVWLSEETRFQLLRGVKTVIHNQTFYCTSFPSAFFLCTIRRQHSNLEIAFENLEIKINQKRIQIPVKPYEKFSKKVFSKGSKKLSI